MFGAEGEIFFDSGSFAYQIREDGTGLRKVIQQSLSEFRGISPDGRWLVVMVALQQRWVTEAFPVGGGSPVRVYDDDARLRWSPDGRLVFLSVGRPTERGASSVPGRTYILPLPAGRMFPEIPAGGFRSEAEMAQVPGVQTKEAEVPRVRVIESPDAVPGPSPEVYAFSRETVQRNLYRIPVP